MTRAGTAGERVVRPPAPEFSRPLPVADIGPGGTGRHIVATPAEREALARRFRVPAILGLEADVLVRPLGNRRFAGTLAWSAEVLLRCVISLETFSLAFRETERLVFVQAGSAGGGRARPVAPDDPADAGEESFYENGILELAEDVAVALSLAMPDHPRRPGAIFSFPGDGFSGQETGWCAGIPRRPPRGQRGR